MLQRGAEAAFPPWYHPSVPREVAETLLYGAGASDGLFLVRDSTSHPGAFVLSLAVNGDIVHHLVEPEAGRFGLFQWTFRNLDDMVDFLRAPHPDGAWATPLKYHVPFNGATYAAGPVQRSSSFHSAQSLERGRARTAIEIAPHAEPAYADLPRGTGSAEPTFVS